MLPIFESYANNVVSLADSVLNHQQGNICLTSRLVDLPSHVPYTVNALACRNKICCSHPADETIIFGAWWALVISSAHAESEWHVVAGDVFYVVEEGSFIIFDDDENELARVGKGSCFGELALLRQVHHPYP